MIGRLGTELSTLATLCLRFILAEIDHSICVSYTNKLNLFLRANINPYQISFIPNSRSFYVHA